MRYLGIDYGEKNIGLAVSDEIGDFVFPLSVLSNNAHFLKKLNDVIKDKDIGSIVIGLPLNFKSEETEMSKQIRKFGKKLGNYIELPIFFENEVLTSQAAARIQGEISTLDASSAALILESFLQRKKSSS